MAVIVIGLIVVAAVNGGEVDLVDDDPPVPTTHGVAYVVSGPGQASVTFENENADTSQETDAELPWSYTFVADEGDFLYISAQNSASFGEMVCTIKVDGVAVETNTSHGAYSICTASGRL